MSVNKVILIGNIGRTPEYKAGEMPITKFSIACTEKRKDKQGNYTDETEWVNCVAFGKTADNIQRFFGKGSEIYIEGKLKTRSWEKDGVKKYATEVIVDNFSFTGGSKKGEQPQQQPQQDQGFGGSASFGGGIPEDGDSLPF